MKKKSNLIKQLGLGIFLTITMYGEGSNKGVMNYHGRKEGAIKQLIHLLLFFDAG